MTCVRAGTINVQAQVFTKHDLTVQARGGARALRGGASSGLSGRPRERRLRRAAAPGGFEQRVAGRGVVRAGWVPQVRVLAHGAVAAFLTHCGWGSTVEGLFRFGRPLVMLPFVADQGLIAREVAARGAGIEVPRNDDDGSFRAADVAVAVRRVMMANEEGEALSRNATELQKVVGDRVRQDQYVDELVGYLQRYK
ncbi:UDP-glycosyltransferase 91B1-like [Miscanthus floridulus]|uniref:UDP-glycosyltransferase 91B1-like n=1 Tax=Miscanthus floridulus TaxID=154761 RepID=UPI00345801D3